MILLHRQYSEISDQLREELEREIAKLYVKKSFDKYVCVQYYDVSRTKLLCEYILGNTPRNIIISGQLLTGIKAWFNMDSEHRLSVIYKFRMYYVQSLIQSELKTGSSLNIVFCKFLINELLQILAESRWQPLAEYSRPD